MLTFKDYVEIIFYIALGIIFIFIVITIILFIFHIFCVFYTFIKMMFRRTDGTENI